MGEYGWFKCTSKEDKKEQTFADFYGEGRVPFTVGIKFGREGFLRLIFTRKVETVTTSELILNK